MKKIELNNVKYDMPDSWDDVTIEDQIRVSKVAAENTGMTSNIALMSGYANIPMKVIKETHIDKLPELLKNLEFLNEDINEDNINEFKHKGNEYFIMPTLLKAQFQDWISLETIQDRFKDNPYEGLPYLVAILAKKDGETLSDYDVEERAKEFYDLPIVIANRISTFFLNLNNMKSFLPTQTSSKSQIVEIAEEQLRSQYELLEITINKLVTGKHSLSKYHKKMLLNFAKRMKQSWEKSLTSTQ